MGERSFQEVVGDIMYGDNKIEEDDPSPPQAEESDDETTPDGTAPGSPEEEPQPEPDTPDAESAEEEDAEEPEEVPEAVEPDDETVEEAGEEDEELEVEETEEPEEPDEEEEPVRAELPEGFSYDDDGNVVAEVGGEQVPADELRKSYYRQADYTQDKQRLSAQEKAWQEREELVEDISQHEGMREFISDHPEAYQYMLRNPSETRELMQSRAALEEFRQDYEALAENPRLAKKYLESSEQEDARATLQAERTARQLVGLADELDRGVEVVADHERYEDVEFTDEEIEEVRQYVMDLGGFNENSSQQEIIQGMAKLQSIFVTPDGQQLDMQLVMDRFDGIAASKRSERDAEDEAAEEHNKSVDAELEEQKKRDPKSPKGTDDPVADAAKLPKRDSLQEVLEGIRGH